jgi:hypothetical protein
MSKQVTNLKRLNFPEISGNDFLIITDVTSSGEIETKKITISDLSDYLVTSSDISDTFRTGSFKGIFIGTLSGSSNSSSISITSSQSDFTNHLDYSSQNGTSSYSVKSEHSFESDNSLYSTSASVSNISNNSITSSYVFDFDTNVTLANYSDFSETSLSSSISQKTFYVSGSINNGTIYHSIYSDKTANSYRVFRLAGDNTAVMERSNASDTSIISNTASFSPFAQYAHQTERAQRVSSGDMDAWAHCSFKIDENYNIIPLTWNNIRSIEFVIQPDDFPGPQIFITYEKGAPTGMNLSVKSICSPFTSTPILNFSDLEEVAQKAFDFPSNYFISSWAYACSSTTAKISTYGYSTGWTGWECIKDVDLLFWTVCLIKAQWLFSSEIKEISYLKNCIFSFAAFPVPTYTSSQISGSNIETPPTTFSTKC